MRDHTQPEEILKDKEIKGSAGQATLMGKPIKGDWRVDKRTTLNKRMNCC